MIDPQLFNVDELSLDSVLLNLLLTGFFALVLKWHFERFASAFSGKADFARLLPFLALVVCLIISVVKSSLALSLGLVGALSIVRFRTPIKEPEELVYLFMAIALGLGFGANQVVLTASSTALILVFVALLRAFFFKSRPKSVFLSLEWESSSEFSAQSVSEFIASKCSECDLRRADQAGERQQLSLMLNLSAPADAFELLASLQERFPGLRSTLVDQSRVPGI